MKGQRLNIGQEWRRNAARWKRRELSTREQRRADARKAHPTARQGG